jgi:hypothetical protein
MQWDDVIIAKYPLPSQMAAAEQLSLIALLSAIRPSCAIEVGTAEGGSLQVLADLSTKVFALDRAFAIPERLPRFANVEFVTGDSHETLPALMRQLHAERVPCPFILIDADHSADGVRRDIESVIPVAPLVKTYLVLHDSFNPECRRGMREAPWASSPYVHSVELDFVQGWFHCNGVGPQREMWGGFALAVLALEIRRGPLQIQEAQQPVFEQMYPISKHRREQWEKRWPRGANMFAHAELVLNDPATFSRKTVRWIGRHLTQRAR